jgi:hypothetical protein
MAQTTEDTSRTPNRFEQGARELGETSGSFFDRLGMGRLAGGILLILIGFLVLVMPDLIQWFVGVGALLLGVLVLWYASVAPRTPG